MLLSQPANGAGNWLEQSVGSVTTVFHVHRHCRAEIDFFFSISSFPKDSAMAQNDMTKSGALWVHILHPEYK